MTNYPIVDAESKSIDYENKKGTRVYERDARQVYPFRLGHQASASSEGQFRCARGVSHGIHRGEDHDRGAAGERGQPTVCGRQVQPCGHQGPEQQGGNHHHRDTEHARALLPRTHPLRCREGDHRAYLSGRGLL